MSKNDYSRYSRQIDLIGNIGQDRLAKSKILCVGAGGLGTLVAAYLLASGIGEITLIDGDKVEITNLTRQITYTEDDCGKYKVLALKEYLNKLNSTCKVITHNIFLDYANINKIMPNHDLIIDCSDNFKTRYLVNDTCKLLEKPLISGSIDGFMGQVMVFLADVCYRCVFPETNSSSSCNNSNVIGPSVGLIASTMANETFKFLTKFNQKSQLIQINSLDNTITRYKIQADPKCKNNHFYDLFDNETQIQSIFFDQILQLNHTAYEDDRPNMESKFVIIDLRNDADKKLKPLLANFLPSVNLDDLLTNKLKIDSKQKVVVVCNYGQKSKLTALQLASLGYKNIYYTDHYNVSGRVTTLF